MLLQSQPGSEGLAWGTVSSARWEASEGDEEGGEKLTGYLGSGKNGPSVHNSQVPLDISTKWNHSLTWTREGEREEGEG